MTISVRDDIIPEWIIDSALASVLPPESEHWRVGSATAGENRVGRSGPTFLKLPIKHPALTYLDAVVSNMEESTFENPRLDYSYAGVFQMLPGASLSPHRDRNTVPRLARYRRRIGIIVFLNDPDGGEFELWDSAGILQSVTPIRGRLIQFDANAYHGVSTVVTRRLTLGIHLMSMAQPNEPPPHVRMTWLADQSENPFAD